MENIILDSSCTIELIKSENSKTLKYLKEHKEKIKEIAITSITMYELVSGLRNEKEQEYLDKTNCISMDCNIMKKAGSINSQLTSKGNKPQVMDCIIATTCIQKNYLLLTTDKGFNRFKEFGLNVEIL